MTPSPRDETPRTDPVKREAGRLGGRATARRKLMHLDDTEIEVMRALEQQARSYRDNTAGTGRAVAAWLRALADKLDTDDA